MRCLLKNSGGVNFQDKNLQEIKKKSGSMAPPRTPDIFLFNEKKYLLNYTEAL